MVVMFSHCKQQQHLTNKQVNLLSIPPVLKLPNFGQEIWQYMPIGLWFMQDASFKEKILEYKTF
jgi:hypothetical protein